MWLALFGFGITVLLVPPLLPATAAQDSPPRAQAGVLDARGWNPLRNGAIDLDGEWEFYWKRFELPQHAPGQPGDNDPVPDTLLDQPGLWNHADVPGTYYPPEGYATLRLRVRLDESWPDTIAFYVLETANSMRMYVNGQRTAVAGRPGRSEAETLHTLRPRSAEFYRGTTDELDIVLQIANYIDREGGRKRPLFMGDTATIQAMRQRRIAYEGLIGGALLIIALYNLVVFLVHRKEKLPLALALVCAVFAADVLFAGERLVLLLFDMPFTVFGKVWFLQYYLMPVSMAILIHYLFPKESAPYFWKGLTLFALVFAAVTATLPFARVIDLLPVYHLATVAAMMYFMGVIALALIRRREHAWPFTAVGSIMIGAAINDLLYAENVIVSIFLSSAGALLFALSVSVMVSQRFARLYTREKATTIKLRRYSSNLEERIGDHTAELDARTDRLESDMGYARMIQHSVLPTDEQLQHIVAQHFSVYEPRDMVGGDFYWADPGTQPGNGWIALGDCTAHGVPGALMVMLTVSLLSQETAADGNNRGKEPQHVLQRLHHGIQDSIQQDREDFDNGVDLAVLQIDGSRIRFAGAHMGIFVLRAGHSGADAVEYYPGSSKGLGHRRTPRDHHFNSAMITLSPEDTVFVLSDGLINQPGGEQGFPFGKRRLMNLLDELSDHTLEQQRESLLAAWDSYRGTHPQRDDIAVLGFRCLG